jgi:hypothetical protein
VTATEEDPEGVNFSFAAAAGEEGEISADAAVLVFPTDVHLTASASISDRRLVVRGSARAVDLARIERELAAGTYRDDPAGAALPGQQISAQVTELIPVRHLVRRDYDFIEKKIVPVYEYDVQRKQLTTRSVSAGADGSFALELAVPDAAHEYEVLLTTTDSSGREQRRTAATGDPDDEVRYHEPSTFREEDRDGAYRIGQVVRLTMLSGGTVGPSAGSNRYLYVVTQDGLVAASVSRSPRFARRFGAADVPGFFVMGVRFTGSAYAPEAGAWAAFDPASRALTVSLGTDKPGYRPGESVALTVRTTDARGRPVAASVVLRAVDEKLYAMQTAWEQEPLDSLYGLDVDTGILRVDSTHEVPIPLWDDGAGGGGGEGGGELRDDFEDSVLFRRVQTNAAGTARVTFALPDDLTSWHVSATAVTAKLQAGEGQLLFPVSLPFFVEATIADEYLTSDRPTIGVRAFGDALRAGDPVAITLSAPSLGLQPTRVTGTAFETIGLELPSLAAGEHAVTIEAVAPGRVDARGTPLRDGLRRTIRVIDTRLRVAKTDYLVLTARAGLPGGDGLTSYTFADTGRGRFVPLLEELVAGEGGRLDQAVARAAARRILVGEFDRDPGTLPPEPDLGRYAITVPEIDPEDPTAYGQAGIQLLVYGGPDAALAARVALAAPDLFAQTQLADALRYTRDLPETSRELRHLALAGLAAFGDPVLDQVRAAAADRMLTIRERIYVALAAEAIGDDATALAIERDLLTRYGQQLGGLVRLDVQTTPDDSAIATSYLAMVAAGVGDPVAPSLFAYVEQYPARDELHVLEEVGYVRRALPRAPGSAASFAWTLDGTRRVVDLEPGESRMIVLTAAQRAAIRVEPLSGRVGVAASWLAPVEPASLVPDPALGLERVVTPAGTIPFGSLVEVELRPTFRAGALRDCYAVVDLVPSGLAPVAWPGIDSDEASESWVLQPDSIVGQRVVFCVPAEGGRLYHLRYRARIITAGTYVWEPALMQLAGVPEALAIVPATRATIAEP